MKRLLLLLPLLALVALPAIAQDVPVPTSAPAVTAPAPAPSPAFGERVWANVGPALADAVSLAVLGALGFLGAFLRAKAAESKAAAVALRITEAARATVLDLDQKLKPQLKAFLEDGKLSDDEKAQLKAAALDTLKTKLPAELLSAATGIFGGFLDTYLSGKVEEAVVQKNALQAAADAPVPPSP